MHHNAVRIATASDFGNLRSMVRQPNEALRMRKHDVQLRPLAEHLPKQSCAA